MPVDDGYENITVVSPMKQYARHVLINSHMYSLIVLDGFFPIFEGCKQLQSLVRRTVGTVRDSCT